MAQQAIKQILSTDLLAETLSLKNEGYRLVAITCTAKDGMELSYTFEKDYDLIHLRFVTDTEEEISSISVMYNFAFLYENEIKELFGVQIKNMSFDFNNSLYILPEPTPYKPKEGKING
ncbi:MAG: ech hydrogenase subunit [Herbinix sp.]|jgi:ech hydrogenase subunit D|nr:ech hydrogenase subunit [Herbinix sp.]